MLPISPSDIFFLPVCYKIIIVVHLSQDVKSKETAKIEENKIKEQIRSKERKKL